MNIQMSLNSWQNTDNSSLHFLVCFCLLFGISHLFSLTKLKVNKKIETLDIVIQIFCHSIWQSFSNVFADLESGKLLFFEVQFSGNYNVV